MPIEIKELHIRVSVNAQPSGQAGADDGSVTGTDDGGGRDAIVGECVEQVLQILQRKVER
jgi:hypothetical protein